MLAPVLDFVSSLLLLSAIANSAVFQRITQSEYDKKALSLKDQQAAIATRIEQHQLGNSDFRTTLETLISLASRAVELFESSKTERKRQLIALMFSNLPCAYSQLPGKLKPP